MPESKCYLCAKPGKFEKLFRKCKHDSACYDCLRDRYVIKARKDVSSYPLKCFHPECNLMLRNTQMERFVRSEKELQIYCQLTAKANAKTQAKLEHLDSRKRAEMQRARLGWLGKHWGTIAEALGEEEVCRCPECRMFIIKNGGCYHMTCLCGADFNWRETRREIDKSCQKIEEKYNRLNQFYAGSRSLKTLANQSKKKKLAPLLRIDEEHAEEYDCEDYDFSAPEEESPDHFCEVETTPQDDCTPSVDLTVGADSVPSDFDSCCLSDFDSSFPSVSLVGPAAGSRTESWEQDDYQVLELASDASDDSWTQLDPEIESRDDDLRSSSMSSRTAAWEEISEVSSVVSFHSKTGLSFLEAARRPKTSSKPSNGGSWKEVSKVPRPMGLLSRTTKEDRKPIVPSAKHQEVVDEMFDADFMFEGAKGGRGGKQKFKTRVV